MVPPGLVVPPNFAPTLSFKGLEHLRLPPQFRDPKSDWFISYLFAIDLTEPTQLNATRIGDQLLIYFRVLAAGQADQDGKMIQTDTFSIVTAKTPAKSGNQYWYTLCGQEPFANATALKQNIRVKVIPGKNEHGVVFISGSHQRLESAVWKERLRIRLAFEAATVPAKPTRSGKEARDPLRPISK